MITWPNFVSQLFNGLALGALLAPLLARAAGLGRTWRELARAGLITSQEARTVSRQESFIGALRVRLKDGEERSFHSGEVRVRSGASA